MTRRGARKSQGKPDDELAKQLFAGSQSENEPSPPKANPKKTPKSSKKEKKDVAQDNSSESVPGEKTPSDKTPAVEGAETTPMPESPKQKASDPSVGAQEAAATDDDDGVVTFNFQTRSAKKAAKSVATDSAGPDSAGSVKSQATVAPEAGNEPGKASDSIEETQKTGSNSQSEPDAVATATTAAPEGSVCAQETEPAAVETSKGGGETAEGKRPEARKRNRNSRKRKASRPQDVIPSKKPSKSRKPSKADDIFFYCGNLPPGVTEETLRFFLEEEGICPRVIIKNFRKYEDKSAGKLTPKQKLYKRNQMKAAKSVFATVIVKTEEEAKKMLFLNGAGMPSPSYRDWDTALKIVRRLPRPDNLPYKVHVGGLHPQVTEEELRLYLEKRGVKPGNVVIIRTQRTQQSRRYGFVWFESVPDADKAVDLPEPFLRDRPLVIKHSFKKKFKNF